MGELYEYERKLEGEGFACGNWETTFVAEIGISCAPLDFGFFSQSVKQPFFSFFIRYSTFVPRGIFSRLGGHRGKSWCWPTFWGEFWHVQQPKSHSRLWYFCKLSVLVTWPRLVPNLWSTICRTSSTPTPSPSPSHAPASQGWIFNASSKLILVHLLNIDIRPSLQSRYQPISSTSKLKSPHSSSLNRHSRDFSSPSDEDRQSRLMANQVCVKVFVTEFMSTLLF